MPNSQNHAIHRSAAWRVYKWKTHEPHSVKAVALPCRCLYCLLDDFDTMRLKPRFSIFALLLLCVVVACLIAGVSWFRSNAIIRSGISDTLVARNGERYPINRWFYMPWYDSTVFETHSGKTGPDLYDLRRNVMAIRNAQILDISWELSGYRGGSNDKLDGNRACDSNGLHA